jgi:hypothetical protein
MTFDEDTIQTIWEKGRVRITTPPNGARTNAVPGYTESITASRIPNSAGKSRKSCPMCRSAQTAFAPSITATVTTLPIARRIATSLPIELNWHRWNMSTGRAIGSFRSEARAACFSSITQSNYPIAQLQEAFSFPRDEWDAAERLLSTDISRIADQSKRCTTRFCRGPESKVPVMQICHKNKRSIFA